MDQSEVISRTIWSRGFPALKGRFRVSTLSSYWLLVIIFCVLIGRSDYIRHDGKSIENANIASFNKALFD